MLPHKAAILSGPLTIVFINEMKLNCWLGFKPVTVNKVLNKNLKLALKSGRNKTRI